MCASLGRDSVTRRFEVPLQIRQHLGRRADDLLSGKPRRYTATWFDVHVEVDAGSAAAFDEGPPAGDAVMRTA